MRKLVVGTFLSLDGVMQAPGGPEEDRSGGFEHGGWTVPFFDEVMGNVMDGWIQEVGGLVLGRKTYEIFAAHWPNVTGDLMADKLNSTHKYVASRTLDRVDWQNSTLIEGDVADAIRELKAESGGELQVHGSGDLIQTLLAQDLVDRFRIWWIPVVLGSGKRLFAEGTIPTRFRLVQTETATTGAVLHVLDAAGRPESGSFALEDPSPAEIERRERVAKSA